MVGQMHQGSPQLAEAWVAYYEGGGVVWAGTAASTDAAGELLEAMAQAIGKGGTPFTGPQELRLGGRRVFTVNDGGSSHFFFQSGSTVIWVTPPPADGLRFLGTALSRFR